MNIHPAALFPAFKRGFDQLHTFGAFGQRPFVGLVFHHVADEVLPLDLEAIVVKSIAGWEWIINCVSNAN